MKFECSHEFSVGIDDDLSIPEKEIRSALWAVAELTRDASRKKGQAMDVKDSGVMLDSLTYSKVKRDKNGNWCVYIVFGGKHRKKEDKMNKRRKPKGASKRIIYNSEVAFINEFGIAGNGEYGRVIKARPFVSEGIQDCADEVAEVISEKLYGDKK